MAAQETFTSAMPEDYEAKHPIQQGDPQVVVTYKGVDYAVKPKHLDHFLKTFQGSAVNTSKKAKPADVILPKEPLKSLTLGVSGLAGIELFNAAIKDPIPLLDDLLLAIKYKGFNPYEARLSLRTLDTSAQNFLKQLALLVGSRGTKMAKVIPKSNDREYVQQLVSVSANLARIHEDLTLARAMSCYPEYGLLGRIANSSLANADTSLLMIFLPKGTKVEDAVKLWLKASKNNAKLTKTDGKWQRPVMKQIADATLRCNWVAVVDSEVMKKISSLKYTPSVKPEGLKSEDSDED